eukprot:scaffold447754_cov19-Prasinocladus_malaysianus.AAC.1
MLRTDQVTCVVLRPVRVSTDTERLSNLASSTLISRPYSPYAFRTCRVVVVGMVRVGRATHGCEGCCFAALIFSDQKSDSEASPDI